jgi:maltooligosyltrehalose trehalohydrolase
VYSGQYSEFRKERHGAPPAGLKHSQLVVFSQNHDQIGNRGCGERSSQLLDFEGQKLAAGSVLLSPFIPLLFMGEEYGERAPFLYFTDHSDTGLGKAVRDGRRAEFAGFHGNEEVPDPQSQSTFLRSKLDHSLAKTGSHGILLDFYKELLRLRKRHPSLAELDSAALDCTVVGKCLIVHWSREEQAVLLVFNFGDEPAICLLPTPGGCWKKIIDSAETKWNGLGSDVPIQVAQVSELEVALRPRSFCAFEGRSAAHKARDVGSSGVRDEDHE